MGVSNLTFFHMMYIYEMAAIFQFFRMANADIPFLSTLKKPETQPLGDGVSNLKIVHTKHISEMVAISQFFNNV